MKLAVIGTGALGSTLLELLAVLPFHSVMLIDPDTLQERNLALSPFLRRAAASCCDLPTQVDVAPFKAELLAREARRARNLQWEAYTCEIADVGWQDLQDVDMFCCCTDSALSRAETAFIARMLHKPMLDGAVFGDGIQAGRVTSFAPAAEAACYLCGMSEAARAAVLGYAASASLGCAAPAETPAMSGTRDPLQRVAAKMLEAVLQVSSGESWPAVSTAVKLSHLENTDIQRELNTQWGQEKLSLARSATCPWHEELPSTLLPLPWEISLRESLISLSGNFAALALQLAWPICTEAVCAACGARSEPFQRVAFVRRRALCGTCGLQALRPVRAVHRLRTCDPLSSLSPRQLGLPARHLYWLHTTADITTTDMNRCVDRDGL